MLGYRRLYLVAFNRSNVFLYGRKKQTIAEEDTPVKLRRMIEMSIIKI